MNLIAVRGLKYPAPSSLALVTRAGGVSKLTAEQAAKVTYRVVAPGESCDDMPKQSIKGCLANGSVRRVAVAATSTTSPVAKKKGAE